MNDPVLDLLVRSPFFEPLDIEDLRHLARQARAQAYRQDDLVLTEGAPAQTLFLLRSGRLRLSFRGPVGGDRLEPPEPEIVVRDVADPGYPVGWSALVAPHRYSASATALEPTEVLAFDREMLERRALARPQFGVRLMEQILWVVGRRLRETRIRLVARRYQEEVIAIRALLDQNAERLRTDSPLHKIPHYLEHRLTLSDAFDTLQLMRVTGAERERDLAGLCLDILGDLRTELEVFRYLQVIYDLVSAPPPGTTPAQVNELICERFAELFARTRHRIVGTENLPAGTGHIFVTNHLCAHPDYVLPNGFCLLFDTNFVSSMIVRKRYGAAPVRVVRSSYADEFGHRAFYEHVNFVFVRGGATEASERTRLREAFYAQAGAVLERGENLVLCPEGNCTTTERSPQPFRPGLFHLAARVRPEPFIVPVALANFDKKLSRTTLTAVVHEPFRLSDRVRLPARGDDLARLAVELQERYRDYVRSAVHLAGLDPDETPEDRPR